MPVEPEESVVLSEVEVRPENLVQLVLLGQPDPPDPADRGVRAASVDPQERLDVPENKEGEDHQVRHT